MLKGQLIDDIRQYNRSAKPQFLSQFTEADLKAYLERLKSAQTRHLRISNVARSPVHRLRAAS